MVTSEKTKFENLRDNIDTILYVNVAYENRDSIDVVTVYSGRCELYISSFKFLIYISNKSHRKLFIYKKDFAYSFRLYQIG